ncbi:methyl-accepting chemotaxis protein [Undibacterium luofuense]|uniref:MCP four helix bundle domain-containing protein n=1 Tax=Undibacterium luofuense TaxID=2828733 RepID=A0A941DJD2_9BURK|nr:methyl-accepting chemotaxis protein [Undibacterium luofuense]MBR7781065.1 MCP four helix bundle domain-containing protein [Undibacterium luofuense]
MKLSQWTVRRRLIVSYLLMFMLLMVVAVTGFYGLRVSNQALHHVVDVNVRKMALLEDMSDAVHVVSRVMRTVALLDDVAARTDQERKIPETREKYNKAFESLKAMPLDNAGTQFVKEIAHQATVTRPLNDRFLALELAGDKAAAASVLMKEAIPANTQWQDMIHHFITLQRGKNLADEHQAELAYQESILIMAGITASALVLVIVISVAITRSLLKQLGGEPAYAVQVAGIIASGDLSKPVIVEAGDNSSLLFAMSEMRQALSVMVAELRSSAGELAHSSDEIASGNVDLSQRTEEQASSLEETAAALEQLTEAVRLNAENAWKANQLASESTALAGTSNDMVAALIRNMDAIGESSGKIVEIISLIDGIAFQTNLLALNAAVEAARAGEQGRGFAVVASEVRTLAQRSASAAKEIKDLIADSELKVKKGTGLVKETEASISSMVSSVRKVGEVIAEIDHASAEQRTGIEHIQAAIANIDQVTQKNSTLVEEAAAASESMRRLSHQLEDMAARFMLAEGLSIRPAAAIAGKGRTGRQPPLKPLLS